MTNGPDGTTDMQEWPSSHTSNSDYEMFLQNYRRIRHNQGWGSDSSAYYRQLPEVSADDHQYDIWKARQVHFNALMSHIIVPLELRLPQPPNIIDLGAGNGWLSHRLTATRNHLHHRSGCTSVTAVDINVDNEDGLGAWRHYGNSAKTVTLLQADFNHLPVASGTYDLAIFNGAFHYSADKELSLSEALRILKPDGILVIMDSPLYQHASAGRAVMRAREADYLARYGTSNILNNTEAFITQHDLESFRRNLGVTLDVVWPISRGRRIVRQLKTKLCLRREAAQFPLIVIKPFPAWVPSLTQRVIRRITEPLLRIRYSLIDKKRGMQPYFAKVKSTTKATDYRLTIAPQVFDPQLFASGEFMTHALNSTLIPKGCSVLDMGTGSGIGAIVAAQWADRVVAVDINPSATECALTNVCLHGLSHQIDIRTGNLFAPVAGERFDVVLFNPPYFHGTPATPLEMAFFATDIASEFARNLAQHLTATGVSLLLLSSRGDISGFVHALRRQKYRLAVVAEKTYITEKLMLFRVTECVR